MTCSSRTFRLLIAAGFIATAIAISAPAQAAGSLVDDAGQISNEAATLELARALRAVKGSERQSLAVYRSIAGSTEVGATARRESADLILATGDLAGAEAAFKALLADDPSDRATRLQLADILARRGAASESRKQFENALANAAPTDPGWRWYASRMQDWGDFHRAVNILRHELARNPHDTTLRIQLAATLMGAQEFEQAAEIYEEVLRTSPTNESAALGLATSWFLAGDFRRASDAATASLTANPSNAELIEIQAKSQTRLAQANRRSQQPTDLNPSVTDGYRIRPPDRTEFEAPDDVIEWADASANSGDYAAAVAALEHGHQKFPDHFGIRMRLAELYAVDRQFDKAIAELDSLLVAFPNNSKLAITRARALSWDRQYAESMAAYDAIIEQSPDFALPRIEKARVAAWAKQMPIAQEAYRGVYGTDDEPATSPNGPDPKHPFNDRQRRAAWLEARAKEDAWHRNFLRASRRLQELTELQGGNQEAWFDRAQANAALGLTSRSFQAYDSLLAIDPLHRMAGDAIDYLETRDRPSAFASYWIWDEKGVASRVSDITRQQIRLGAQFPIRQDYKASIYSVTWLESPDRFAETFPAEGFWVEFGGAPADWFSFSARYAFKAYFDPALAPTNTGGVTFSINAYDYATISLGYAREDVIHNRFGLFQGTQADNFAIGIDSALNRQIEISGDLVLRRYSDDNFQTDARADLGILLLDHPRALKLVLTGQYLNTQNENIFRFDGTDLQDVTYPYWTPQDYFRGMVALEWRHDLSSDFFFGSPLHYYGIKIRGGLDTDINASIAIEGEYFIEFARRWSFRIVGSVERSREWNGASAYTSLQYQF